MSLASSPKCEADTTTPVEVRAFNAQLSERTPPTREFGPATRDPLTGLLQRAPEADPPRPAQTPPTPARTRKLGWQAENPRRASVKDICGRAGIIAHDMAWSSAAQLRGGPGAHYSSSEAIPSERGTKPRALTHKYVNFWRQRVSCINRPNGAGSTVDATPAARRTFRLSRPLRGFALTPSCPRLFPLYAARQL